MEGTSRDNFMEEVSILMFGIFLIDYIYVCVFYDMCIFNICCNVYCLQLVRPDSAPTSPIDASVPPSTNDVVIASTFSFRVPHTEVLKLDVHT